MQAWGNSDINGNAILTRLQYRGLLFLIFVAGAAVRLYRIADQVVLDDEWHALNAVQYHDFSWIFTHFGSADHSIPLALLYEFQYQVTGLSEILMRWPMLLAGCAALLVIPYLLRHWMSRPERLMLAALLAISPLLIYYSRFARPYALLVLLEPCALLMAWHWWKSKQLKFGLAWVLLAGLSAWLNTPALILVTAPFAWFGILATKQAVKSRDWSALRGLVAIGMLMLVLFAALLGPPLSTQAGAIMSKAGQHFINRETLPWALSLASGSGHLWVYAPLGFLSLLGAAIAYRRDREFGFYMLVTCILAILVLIVTGAAFALHGNVFLRYMIGLVPFFLGCVAVGLVYISTQIVSRTGLPVAMNTLSLTAITVILVMTGPIPDWPLRNNQFVTHQNYHFHYNWEHNLYTQAMKDWYQAEPFYAEIAANHDKGEAIIVEAPWHMASYSNPINLQQEVHGQRVKIGFINGVCAGPLFGELDIGQPGMKFRNFVYLQELLDGTQTADYLVLRRKGMPKMARVINMDFNQCEQAVRARFGEPWRESEFALVFKTDEVAKTKPRLKIRAKL